MAGLSPARSLWALLTFTLFSASLASSVVAQVTLAPTFVLVDASSRYGTVMISNATPNEQEVFVTFQFGYPAVDSEGRRYIEYEDAETASMHSASRWVRSYPERFRLAPKSRQRVRLMLSPPDGLEDGLYWTRMVVTSRESSPRDTERAAAQVNFEFKQVIPVVYSKGRLVTSAHVRDLLVHTTETNINLTAVVERDGDVPFIGTINLDVVDEDGVHVQSLETKMESYFESATLFSMDRADLEPGTYFASVTLLPRRRDVRTGALPEMEPVTRRFRFDVEAPVELTSFSIE